jgi:hypothetical protein
MDCYAKTYAADGIAGFWVGAIPNIVRNSVINATELASYDQYKQMAMAVGMGDSLPTHIICSFGAGFNAVCVGSPVDVLKTRLMNKLPGDPANPLTMVAQIF